jgi:hypothetical protein
MSRQQQQLQQQQQQPQQEPIYAPWFRTFTNRCVIIPVIMEIDEMTRKTK